MQRTLGLVGFLAFFVASSASATVDDREENLPEKYRTWLKAEVTYIISEVEKETFLSLESERERESFIEAFWRKRDTSPSTPENEYRIEHYERLEYANKFLGRDTFKQGWQTDRGRYYILLGAPLTRVNFEAKAELYPAELWFYNKPELKRVGLPPFLYLLFFRRHGGGEFQLYSPLADGPQALLVGPPTSSMDFRDDIERAYEKLRWIDPELAQASLSFRTDEGDNAQFQAVSFGTLELLADIASSPFRGLDTSYAERLDFERGTVESDYLFTYVPSSGLMNVMPGPEGAFYLHWAVELDAQYVGLVRDDDRGIYATVFIASIEVVPRDDENQLVTEFRKESFITLTEAEAKNSLKRPFSYSGMMPLIPGAYSVRVILRNRACPGRDESDCIKSYTLFESDVDVPEWQTARPELAQLVLGYGSERREGEPQYRPFRFGNVQLLPNARGVYPIGAPLVVATEALNAPPGSRIRFQVLDTEATGKVWLEKTVPVANVFTAEQIQELSLADFEGGRYELVATLLDAEGTPLHRQASPFTVSPRTAIARPGVLAYVPQVRPEIPGVIAMSLGEQYLNIGQKDKARALLMKAVSENPKLGPARERLARLLIEEGDVDGVVELLETVYEEAKDRYGVLATLGEAYFHQKEYAKSTELLEKAITLRRAQTRLLNLLALGHYQLGNHPRALEVLERSLSIDPDQKPVKDLLEKVRAGASAPSQQPR